jgi:broad specificity phosphatase PhoE
VDRLILVRHAETALSAAGVIHRDAGEDAPLTAAGEAAARELGRALRSEPIAAAAASPRLRARRTAELLLDGRRLAVEPLDELAEIRSGEFAGGPAALYREWTRSHPLAAAPPGGESVLTASGRYLAGLRRLLALPGPVVLAVLHNLPMRMALNAAAGADPVAGPEQALPHLARRDLTAAELRRAIEALEAWRASAGERTGSGPVLS